MATFNVLPGSSYLFRFTNFRGEESERHVIARLVQWGETPWHKDTQFFLEAFDLDKQEVRQFPVESIDVRSLRAMTDQEVDFLLSKKIMDAEDVGYNKAVEEAKASVAAGKLSLGAGDQVG